MGVCSFAPIVAGTGHQIGLYLENSLMVTWNTKQS